MEEETPTTEDKLKDWSFYFPVGVAADAVGRVHLKSPGEFFTHTHTHARTHARTHTHTDTHMHTEKTEQKLNTGFKYTVNFNKKNQNPFFIPSQRRKHWNHTKSTVNPINYIHTLRHFIQWAILPVRWLMVEADELQTVLTTVDRQVSHSSSFSPNHPHTF